MGNNNTVIVNVQGVVAPEPEPEAEDELSDFEVVAEAPAPVVAPLVPAPRLNTGFIPVPLGRPILQRPTGVELRNPSIQLNIVWSVPGYGWPRVHWGLGKAPWNQVRSHAADHLAHLPAPHAFRQIGSHRACGCNHNQLEAAFRREAAPDTSCPYYLWRRTKQI